MVPLVGVAWAEVKTLVIGTVQEPVLEDGERRVHTTDLSYCSRLADHETFARLALVKTHRRGVATAGTVVGVTDGSAWLQGFLDYHRPDAVRILDFPHAVEHLTAAAQATFGPGPAAATWLAEQAHALKHEDPLTLLTALRHLPTAGADDPPAAATARNATLAYLTERWDAIQYARFQALGYPIGSGIAESANKLVVEARLKGSGMHWAPDHIVTRLRTGAAEQRRARHQARRPAAPAPPPAAPGPPPARPQPRCTAAIPRLRPVRSSQPHPWSRPLLRGARVRQPTDAKD